MTRTILLNRISTSPAKARAIVRLGASFLGLVIACFPAVSGYSQHLNAMSIQVSWKDGDRISGRMLSWKDDSIRLQCPLFSQPVDLIASKIEAIRIASATQPDLEKQSETTQGNRAHQLTLTDGSILKGIYQNQNDGIVSFADHRFGTLQIPAAKVAKLEETLDTRYAWRGELNAWVQEGQQWFVDSQGSLATKNSDSSIWMPLDLQGSFAIEFSVSSIQALDFSIATGPELDESLRFGKIGDSWIVGTNADFEIVDSINSTAKRLNLRLIWSEMDRTWSLHQGSHTLVQVKDTSATSRRTGLKVHNLGNSLTVESLQIKALDNRSDKQLPEFDSALIAPTEQNFDQILWADGTSIWCTIEGLNDGRMTITLPALRQTVSCSSKEVGSIRPRKKQSEPESRNLEVSSVIQGQDRLRCDFFLNHMDRRVELKSTKLNDVCALSNALPYRLHRNKASKPSDKPARTGNGNSSVDMHTVFMESGEVIACRVLRAGLASTWIQTNLNSAELTISNDKIRAIELNHGADKPRFTQESRTMMLSIPRNLEADQYTHALIGRNGDLLRGNLVSLNAQNIEFDSKQEPLLIDRAYVSTLVYLHPETRLDTESDQGKAGNQDSSSKESSRPPVEASESVTQKDSLPHLRLQLYEGFAVFGTWIGGDDNAIHLNSSSLGECRVPLSAIQSIWINDPTVHQVDFDNSGIESEPYDYFSWNTKSTLSPRWKAETASGVGSANELVGTTLPSLEMPSSRGDTARLSDYVGKVVVLDFWATWCGPCVASLPDYLATVRRFPDSEVMFFGINSTENPATVREFLSEKKWGNFVTLFDYDQAASRAMRVQGIPHTVVIGRDGKIAHIQIGYSPTAAEELYQLIEKLLQ